MTPDEAYRWLAEHSLEIAYLKSMGQVLGWDQRTHIPPKGIRTAITSSPCWPSGFTSGPPTPGSGRPWPGWKPRTWWRTRWRMPR